MATEPEQADIERSDGQSWAADGPAAVSSMNEVDSSTNVQVEVNDTTVQEQEQQQQEVEVPVSEPEGEANTQTVEVANTFEPQDHAESARVFPEGLRSSEETLVRVELIPTATGVPEVAVTGYGPAPSGKCFHTVSLITALI